MTPQFKNAWVAALRSGEYTQGYGFLHQLDPDGHDTYCCLGVACEVAKKLRMNIGLVTADAEILPDYAAGVMGFYDRAGTTSEGLTIILSDGNEYGSLAEANDHGGTFAQIADAIEKVWENL